MKYLVKGFRLSLRKATIKGHTTLVRRWIKIDWLCFSFRTKKEALGQISSSLLIDKQDGYTDKYKYTIQCIGGKNGKR